MLNVYQCDLHIHTCLSPCAKLDMHPAALIERALMKGLDVIAICDHNASANVPYVTAAAQGRIRVIPGMEITTAEEVHVLAFFESIHTLFEFQKLIDDHLPGRNDEDRFGVQAVVNEIGEVESINEQLLIGATTLSIDRVVDEIHRAGGLAIPAHIDRESFSVLSQLGFIASDAAYDALEISGRTGIANGRSMYPELHHYAFLTSSDAHFPSDIGKTPVKIQMAEPTFSELKQAILNQNGRHIVE